VGNPSMQAYWDGYFIHTGSLYDFFKSLTEGMRTIIVSWFLEKKWAMRIATIFMPFCWVAMVRYFWQSVVKYKGAVLEIDSICLVLMLELIILGILHAFPFTGCRATLFIAPFIFYMLVRGIYLFKKIKLILYPLIGVYILFLSAVSYNLLTGYLKLYVQ
jgi:hypothetical protein